MNPATSTATTPLHPGQEWQVLVLLAGVQFTHILDFMVMMPLGPQFMRIFHITPTQFALLVSSYTFTAAAANLFGAFRLDRYDRKRALLFVYGWFALATLACALAPAYVALLFARAAAGAFGGILNATVQSIIGDVIPEYRRGRATATVSMAFSAAAVVGVPLGLALANAFSWRASFLAVALICVGIWAAALRVLPPIAGHLSAAPRGSWQTQARAVLGDPNHRYAMLLVGTLLFAGFTVIPFVSPYLVGNLGVLEHELSYVYFAGGLATLVSSRIIGQLADRFGKKRMFSIIAGLSTIPLLAITQLPRMPLPAILVVTTVFFVLVSGRFIPAMALINSSANPAHRGSFMSFVAATQSLCSGLAVFGAGLVVERSASGALTHYGVIGMFAALATLCAILLAQKLKVRG